MVLLMKMQKHALKVEILQRHWNYLKEVEKFTPENYKLKVLLNNNNIISSDSLMSGDKDMAMFTSMSGKSRSKESTASTSGVALGLQSQSHTTQSQAQ